MNPDSPLSTTDAKETTTAVSALSPNCYWEHQTTPEGNRVRGFGHSPDSAFVQAALALTTLVTDPACIDPYRLIQIDLRGADLEQLFSNWISTLADSMSSRHLLFSAFDVCITGHHLHSCLWGEPLDMARHQPSTSLSELHVIDPSISRSEEGIWIAEYIVTPRLGQ